MTTRPGLDEFLALARDHTVIPVWRELASDTLTPVAAFLRLAGVDGTRGTDLEPRSGKEGTEPLPGEPAFLLESVEHGMSWGRFSFAGRRPAATLVSRRGRITTEGAPLAGVPSDSGILASLEALLERCVVPDAASMPGIAVLPPLHSGMVGYLGYDVVREVERLADPPPDDLRVPDAVMSVIGELAAFDHWRQRVYLIATALLPTGASGAESAYQRAVKSLDAMEVDLERSHPGERLDSPPVVVSKEEALATVKRSMSSGEFVTAVKAAKERILAGDAFQIVLSQRFDLDLDCDPFDVYRVLRQVNPSPYMYFFRHPEVTLVGSSPEPMVQLSGGRVISRPIAGTRPRGTTDEEDRRLAAELVEHPKELAEHVMLVDLARNDVGRVVRFGTEKVDEMMTLERYSHVMHLTSQVSGELSGGRGPIDVLRATLPAGTVSGAPKVSAMTIIDELELTKRGPYAGVVGYLDFSGNVDTAIAIRTLVVNAQGRASVQAGAGIVVDSDPAMEDQECQSKAAALLTAAGAARRAARQRRG